MIACAWLPHFALQVVAHRRADLAQPVAIASVAAAHPTVLDCSAAARAEGVEPGMLVSRAMGCCAALQVLDVDDERVAHAAERFLQRLESIGAAVHPSAPGRAFFDIAPLERLYGGRQGVVARVRRCFSSPHVRLGVGPNPFVAWVAARHAPAGGQVLIEHGEAARVLAEMPVSLLPADPHFLELLRALGITTLAQFAGIAREQVSDRFGDGGLVLHDLARGVDPRQLAPRQPSEPVEADFEFPEPAANVHTLRRAVHMLVERAVAHPRCAQHAPRSVVVVASLATGGSWRARRVLRAPTVDAARIALTAQVGLEEVPAPVERLTVRLEQLELRTATQQQLLPGRGTAITNAGGNEDAVRGVDDERVQSGVRHVQATVGEDSLLQVLEVEPESRILERHAVLVPRQAAGGADAASAGRGVWE